MNSKRNLIITGIVGIAVVLGFVALRGVKAPSEGTQGAIGTANRYQTEQITAKDVKLEDAEMQAFIQSDTFHKLATNPEFRQMVMDANFQEVARNAVYQAMVLNKDQVQILGNKQFAHYLVEPATVAMVTSPAFVQMTAECNMSELLRKPAFFVLMASVLENKPSEAEFKTLLLQSRELSQSFVDFANKHTEVVMAALQPALFEAKEMLVSMNGTAELLGSPGLGKLLENKSFGNVMMMQAHEELMRNPEIMALAFSSEVFNKLVQTQRLSELEKGFHPTEVK